MPYLILSPHSDDAVLSCGASMALWQQQGESVVVFTIFDGTITPPWSTYTDELVAKWGNPPDIGRLRRAEDEAALAKLGAANLAAHLLEAHYRRSNDGVWLYTSYDALFGEVHPADDTLATAVLAQLTANFEPRHYTVVSPLAIGRHVDHQLTFEAAKRLVRAGHDVMFFEDYPYAAISSSYWDRMNELSGLEPVLIAGDSRTMMTKIEALSYYRSQIPALFSDSANMAVDVIDFARQTGGAQAKYGERFWKVADAAAFLSTDLHSSLVQA